MNDQRNEVQTELCLTSDCNALLYYVRYMRVDEAEATLDRALNAPSSSSSSLLNNRSHDGHDDDEDAKRGRRMRGGAIGSQRGCGRDAIEWTNAALTLASSSTSRHHGKTKESRARIERGILALCDAGETEKAKVLARGLLERFGDASSRMAALRGAILEAEGSYDDAEAVYDAILKENEGDQRILRRKIACAKSRGDDALAKRRLSEYLEIFGADADGWLELGKLHAAAGDYDRAVFCYEEVLCAMPYDPNAHRRLAEVLYTMGGEENARDAKNHFAAALDFTAGKDVRSLYGVVLCSKRLQQMNASAGSDGAELADAAAERLLQRYASSNESLLRVVRPQLSSAISR